MKFILGKKIEMKQKFEEDGKVIPFTEILAGPCFVVQIKTKDKDGYSAVQIGFGEEKKITKPLKGHLKNLPAQISVANPELKKFENFSSSVKNKTWAGLGNLKYLKEFRVKETELKVGDKIDISIFKQGDKVAVSGISKGKGYQGVVKRHHFAGGPGSHGNKDQLRMPGSIGSTAPQRVFKGLRMAGHMGAERITVKNLKVVEVIPEKNLLLLRGAVPGGRNSLLEIKSK